MIERKIDAYLRDFYSNHKQAVMLTGARQTGKTFAIRRLGNTQFKHFIEINFLETPDAKLIFGKGVNGASEILLRLSTFTDKPMVKGETLIFFDEVQECPECVTMMKFLVDDASYRYALSGSLLGVELKDLRSEPVGYIDVKDVFPLDFEEFIKALGVKENVMKHLQECFEQKVSVDAVVHERVMKLFQLYLIVGGMPAAVSKYLETNNLRDVDVEQQSILHLYHRDIAKYDPAHKLYIQEIFDLIPSELDAKNKRFILKNLNEHFKFSRYENSFLWLKDAGVAYPTYNIVEPVLPLKLNEQRNLFKLFHNDVGLLCSQYADGIQLKMLSGEVNMNYGAVYENAVAQELAAHGFCLYYFNSKKQGELDFVVKYHGAVLPIEVKSGKDYSVHSALDNVMNTNQYQIPEAIVLCNDNVSIKNRITYYPIYMTLFLHHREEPESMVYIPDLSGL